MADKKPQDEQNEETQPLTPASETAPVRRRAANALPDMSHPDNWTRALPGQPKVEGTPVVSDHGATGVPGQYAPTPPEPAETREVLVVEPPEILKPQMRVEKVGILDETVPGGRYIVGGQVVNAEGVPVK